MVCPWLQPPEGAVQLPAMCGEQLPAISFEPGQGSAAAASSFQVLDQLICHPRRVHALLFQVIQPAEDVVHALHEHGGVQGLRWPVQAHDAVEELLGIDCTRVVRVNDAEEPRCLARVRPDALEELLHLGLVHLREEVLQAHVVVGLAQDQARVVDEEALSVRLRAHEHRVHEHAGNDVHEAQHRNANVDDVEQRQDGRDLVDQRTCEVVPVDPSGDGLKE
mmetsp:Transcript_28807/g.72992  ORF Transcript_28807/g.72992 Transcript_28807/m.72992 type:complete len:221 (-) Transcript_28807:1376-2038(-)